MASWKRSRYRIVELSGTTSEVHAAGYQHVGTIVVGGTSGALVRRASGHFYQRVGTDYWRLIDERVVKALAEQG